MILAVLRDDIINKDWSYAIEQSIERIGSKGTTTGFKTYIDGELYTAQNSNAEKLCYKTCKMHLRIEEPCDFEWKIEKK